MQDNPANRDQQTTDNAAADVVNQQAAQADAAASVSSDQLESSGHEAEAALAEAQAQIAALKEEFLRAKAETENVRRRGQEEKEKAHKFAIESFAEHLLPVVDSLEAGLGADASNAEKLREGMDLTLKQLLAALEKGRIKVVAPEANDKFDPHFHQAISMVPADQEPNTVVTVLQKGYVIAERVLRPALVMVAAPK
ncbi:heat shock protein GrpE [Robbsia andropogonis]|uniref:Protein GrpE n=1 Tax=Robbsia andropogonis TaxID=28092 RepID=A0A0F5JZH4_9BURK|nr:nucleotide exchange factor GrpE [Robbsia andropogonis]KKB63070.1 heat shock protein GrpE [Robbsia andropogonis]MCP1118388.1 nucleotide exchange factor GrpE [Robbsia andropogonis]MCP1127833.1 nucleotide exchange factor GrpE [Robbsia andropogonis]